jgi:hypothetical protein
VEGVEGDAGVVVLVEDSAAFAASFVSAGFVSVADSDADSAPFEA